MAHLSCFALNLNSPLNGEGIYIDWNLFMKANNPDTGQPQTATNEWLDELTLKVSMNFSSSSGGKKSPM